MIYTPKEEVINKMHSIHGKHLSSLHHDFLPTCSEANDKIIETPDYFQKTVNMFGLKNLRLWKKSGKVSISKSGYIRGLESNF